MNTHPATVSAYRQLSPISASGLLKAMDILDTEAPIDRRTAMLPDEIADQVIAEIDNDPKPTLAEANELAARLLRNYPDLKANDPKGYVLALVEVFCAYPLGVGIAACDPVKGLPSALRFTPKTADLKACLEVRMKRRDLIRANALSHKAERRRRLDVAREEAEFERNRGTIDERRAHVQRILAGFRETNAA